MEERRALEDRFLADVFKMLELPDEVVLVDSIVLVNYLGKDGHNEIAFITSDSTMSNLIGLLILVSHRISKGAEQWQ